MILVGSGASLRHPDAKDKINANPATYKIRLLSILDRLFIATY